MDIALPNKGVMATIVLADYKRRRAAQEDTEVISLCSPLGDQAHIAIPRHAEVSIFGNGFECPQERLRLLEEIRDGLGIISHCYCRVRVGREVLELCACNE